MYYDLTFAIFGIPQVINLHLCMCLSLLMTLDQDRNCLTLSNSRNVFVNPSLCVCFKITCMNALAQVYDCTKYY